MLTGERLASRVGIPTAEFGLPKVIWLFELSRADRAENASPYNRACIDWLNIAMPPMPRSCTVVETHQHQSATTTRDPLKALRGSISPDRARMRLYPFSTTTTTTTDTCLTRQHLIQTVDASDNCAMTPPLK